MKKVIVAVVVISFLSCFAAFAHADLADFLNSLNTHARGDMNGFSQKLSNQFDVPVKEGLDIIHMVENPADAFMILQLCKMTKKSPKKVMKIYKRKRREGWGIIVQKLGIKPGSSDFHILTRGDFFFTGRPAEKADMGPGKGKDIDKAKGKDVNKEKDKGKERIRTKVKARIRKWRWKDRGASLTHVKARPH